MNTPQVSVVMGAYNCAGTLEETVRSVLDQDGVALELVVVDDGSTDGTPALLDRLAHEHARLRVIHQANAGLTKALVHGCRAARAPFVARQDAGDVSLPGRLRRQADLLQAHPQLAFVSCATEFVDETGAFLFRHGGSGRARDPVDVLDLRERHGMRDGPSHHGSVMFRRDLYEQAGGYRPEFYFGQDWDLWYRLAQLGQFCIIGDTLYRARVGVGDISTTRKPMQERLAALSLRALHERMAGRSDAPVLADAARIRPEGPRDPRAVQGAAAQASYFLGECLRRNGDAARASHYFRQALRDRPWLVKAWVRLAQARLQGR